MRKATTEEVSLHLGAFAKSFILDAKRERYLEFANSPKRVAKWLEQLDHFQKNLNLNYATSVSNVSAISELLGCFPKDILSVDVFVYSTLRNMNGVFMSFLEALESTFQMGNGAIISVEPGMFCVYFGEESNERYILKVE